ncbi:MAG: APC family permease [Pseudomonadales bacterium]|nr:APC family permease [Pseudomonadales bacterium]
MYASGKPIGFWSAVLLGMGAMIGAGIFALLGQAGAVAGTAVWLSFLLGGGVAMLSGYSFARLGVRYPSSGGLVEYLVRGWGDGFVSGTGAFVLYLSGVLALALIAKAFGSYASAVVLGEPERWLVDAFALSVVAVLTALNLRGAGDVTRFENLVVLLKIGVLCLFVGLAAPSVETARLAPGTYPGAFHVAASIGFTFFAFEGFRVITNAAEDMPDPGRMLPASMFVSIALVAGLYVLLSLVVFGTLSVDEAVAAKDYALARAATPVLGPAGFLVVGIAAMVSTASAINANLYAVTNVAYRMATFGALPAAFGRPIARSREGLLITAAVVMLLVPSLDLASIAVVGSLTILLVHIAVHAGHLRLLRETGASGLLVTAALLASSAVVATVLAFELSATRDGLARLAAFVAAAVALELLFRHLAGRGLRRRQVPPPDEHGGAGGTDDV